MISASPCRFPEDAKPYFGIFTLLLDISLIKNLPVLVHHFIVLLTRLRTQASLYLSTCLVWNHEIEIDNHTAFVGHECEHSSEFKSSVQRSMFTD